MPARWEIGNFDERAVALNHPAKRHKSCISYFKIAHAEKLPTVIIRIVVDMQNRLTIENNRS